MATVIDQILSIDAIAQGRLNDVTQLKRQLKEETETKMAENNALIERKSDEKIRRVREEEEARTAQAKDRITSDTDKSILRLEKIYEQTHQKLEQDIFQRVIENTL